MVLIVDYYNYLVICDSSAQQHFLVGLLDYEKNHNHNYFAQDWNHDHRIHLSENFEIVS